MFRTPLGHARTLMSGEIVPNQQHSDWRQKPVQLLGCGVNVPILPTPSFGNQLGSCWTLLQDRQEVRFEPGMQDGIGGVFHRFGSQFSSRRTEQRQQFGWVASDVLVVLPNGLSFRLEGWPS